MSSGSQTSAVALATSNRAGITPMIASVWRPRLTVRPTISAARAEPALPEAVTQDGDLPMNVDGLEPATERRRDAKQREEIR